MNRTSVLLLAAAMIVGAGVSAQAATILTIPGSAQILSGVTLSDGVSQLSSGAVVNINAWPSSYKNNNGKGLEQSYGTASSGWTLGGGSYAALVNTNASGDHVLSFDKGGDITDKDKTLAYHYLTVGSSGNLPSSVTYTFTHAQTNLSFDWGTVDDYNTLTVYHEDGSHYAISGKDLKNADGNITFGKTGVLFSLYDPSAITSFVLTASGVAFEVKDIAATPIPAALGLFGAAVAGMAAYRRRRIAA